MRDLVDFGKLQCFYGLSDRKISCPLLDPFLRLTPYTYWTQQFLIALFRISIWSVNNPISSNANGFSAVHRMNEEQTRQDLEDMINSIHEPSLEINEQSFSSYSSEQPSPPAPRNRFLTLHFHLNSLSMSCHVILQTVRFSFYRAATVGRLEEYRMCGERSCWFETPHFSCPAF